MKRVFFVETPDGRRRLDEADFPLSVGGDAADIVLQESLPETPVAHIALSSGHAYIQPAATDIELFHNHEYIDASSWLKSGDRVQLGERVLCWDVKGDQVFIKVIDQFREFLEGLSNFFGFKAGVNFSHVPAGEGLFFDHEFLLSCFVY